MKYYIRQIKPYIQPPALQGCNCEPYPVEGYDWVSEDYYDTFLTAIHKKEFDILFCPMLFAVDVSIPIIEPITR